MLLSVRGVVQDVVLRPGPRGKAAGEGRVVVGVEGEEAEEVVRDGGEGAVLRALDAVVEFEGTVSLGARWEGNPLGLVVGVFGVVAGYAGGVSGSRGGPGERDWRRMERATTYVVRFMHST